MELRKMRGLAAPTIQKLNKAGVKTVEQLALLDVHRRKVAGVTTERLVSLRRAAQKTVFQSAASRFRVAAQTAAESLETLVRRGAEQALAAAKEAEKAAAEAIAHAQTAASDFAEQAALQAVRARRAAEAQLSAIRKSVQKGPKRRSARVEQYWALLERAEDAARVAADKAIAAAQSAKEMGVQAVAQTEEKAESLYHRLVKKVSGAKSRGKSG